MPGDLMQTHKICVTAFPTVGVDDLLEMAPKGAEKVVIELVEGATPLPVFNHPRNAFTYLVRKTAQYQNTW